MSAASIRTRRQHPNIWPGFVDALAALLMVVVFLVMVFALAQFFLSDALSGRDDALERLNQQVEELASLLSLERAANADQRLVVAQLSAQLQSSLARNEDLGPQVAGLIRQRAALVSEQEALRLKLAALEQDLAASESARQATASESDRALADLEDAFAVIAADKETIEVQLRDLESLRRDLIALRSVRDDLESQVSELAGTLGASREQLEAALATIDTRDAEVGELRDRRAELEARLADTEERTVLAQREIEAREIRLAELLQQVDTGEQALAEQVDISDAAQQQVSLLNQQLVEIRRQLAALNDALDSSEADNEKQQALIVDLGNRLNQALATRVQELAGYRSEFFGRLRELLGQRADVQIVGDRFVLQSEVLFASAAAELEDAGKAQLTQIADTLKEIARTIPDDLDWVLRVDGHTDVRPIRTPQFPTNWELSTARATSVVKFLIERGLPPEHLVAAGFGQFQPLDSRDDEIGYRRNRRIEFKLTQK